MKIINRISGRAADTVMKLLNSWD